MFVTGSTNSLDLPAARNSLGGAADAFVAKISPDGSAVEWSVYVGGSGIDGGAAIVVRPDGSLVIAGDTNSADFPGIQKGEVSLGAEGGFIATLMLRATSSNPATRSQAASKPSRWTPKETSMWQAALICRSGE